MAFDSGGVIARGMLYIGNSEHTPSQPIARGWELSCINATSGQGIWNITGGFTVGPVADGYLTAGNSYDGYLYVFGKGQSATTVSYSSTRKTMRFRRLNEHIHGILTYATTNRRNIP